MKNQGIIFSAGGLKGAFQIGAMTTLLSNDNFNPKVLSGISTGALTAANFAQAEYGNRDQMVIQLASATELYNSLNGSLGRVRWPGGKLGRARGLLVDASLERPERLEALMKEHIDPRKLIASGREYRAGSVNLNTGDYVQITQHHPHLLDAILSSASIPVLWPPVWIDGHAHVDGAVRNMFPFKDTIDALKSSTELDEPLEIYLVLTSPISTKQSNIQERGITVLDVIGRSMDILLNEILLSDIREVQSRNLIAGLPGIGYRKISVKVIFPEEHYDIGMTADPDMIQRMVREGMERAKNPIDVSDLQTYIMESRRV